MIVNPSRAFATLGVALLSACRAAPSSSEASGDTHADTSTSGPDLAVDDTLPPVPTPTSPPDGATDQPLELELCWTPVEDPDGEPVRYRVWIDDMLLTEGRLGDEDGYAGPCVGPLLFAVEREYAWQVEAYEVDDPSRGSGRSPVSRFRTIGDGLSETVFADDFEDDLGWTVEGDAFAGAWVLGDPDQTLDPDAPDPDAALAQPSACPNGVACYFTGANPDGVATDEDVSGGATTLTSPAFDLAGAAAATVRLTRFFYKSDLLADAGLEIALLTPDPGAPGGYQVHVLEQLELDSATAGENGWRPREYAVCDAPMLAGSRLRIRAHDLGDGLLEAAIDSVSVHAFDDPSLCADALGGHCDPLTGASACAGELLCCPQGPVDVGVHRCEIAVAGLDFADPPTSPADPGTGPLGCDAPDLIVEPLPVEPLFTDIFMSPDTCEVLEGCVGGVGWRRVMLFTTSTPNIGSQDLALGVAANLPDLFHYSACHDHYHFDEYARYELRDGEQVIATGHKQAFCLLDTTSWAWPLEPGKFDCANQGISRGFTDWYEAGLPCQWVDVTDTPPGDYTLRVTLNQPRPEHLVPALVERDHDNNMVELPVTVPPP